MHNKEIDPIKRLKPGYHAFSNKGRVVEFEIIEYEGVSLGTEILFSMYRLGPDEEKVVLVHPRGSIGLNLETALKELGKENTEIVREFAREEAERENRIRKYQDRTSEHRRARRITSRTGEISGGFRVFKSDSF